MQTISEARLESDLAYRFGYLAEFLGFSPDDIAAKRKAYASSGKNSRIGAHITVETSVAGHQTALVVTHGDEVTHPGRAAQAKGGWPRP